uniref:Uncharacterized protein n=1 Tax=Panagrolaimus sp. PS1159 TaxID=55785 RepID=A0AC35GEQ6_9BILA
MEEHKTIAQLLSDIKLLSPSGNEKCQDATNNLDFKLAFVGDEKYIRGEVKTEMLAFVGDEKYIRGEIKMKSEDDDINVMMYLFQKCGRTERSDYYATGIIEGAELPLESTGRICFKNGEPPFRQHGTNTGDNV